jgi:hypothetical protein
MGLPDGRASLRPGTRWRPEPELVRLDEDWGLVLLGVIVLAAAISLAVLTAWTVQQRDTALAAATAAAARLDPGGVDSDLYQALVTAQQDQIGLRLNTPGQSGATALNRAQHDLNLINGRVGDSSPVRRDTALISWELARYTPLEASAQGYSQQGLPVGAAYLREASGYLSGQTLRRANDIRRLDQGQITAVDAAASAVPWQLFAADALVLACLAGAQVITARYARRLLNPGLVLATVLLIGVVAWSATALAVSLSAAGRDAAPHARAASALAQAGLDGTEARTDDLLTLADQGEDCTAITGTVPPFAYDVGCRFETQVVGSLARPGGTLRKALAQARTTAPDRPDRVRIAAAAAAERSWLRAEHALPTLQNLEADATRKGLGRDPRYQPSFLSTLSPYTTPDPQLADLQVQGAFARFRTAVQAATGHEWRAYERQAGAAGGALSGLVLGSLLLGLLATAAAAAGIGWRVREYWSADRRAA